MSSFVVLVIDKNVKRVTIMLVSLIILGVVDKVNVVIRIMGHKWAVQHPLELWNKLWKVMMV